MATSKGYFARQNYRFLSNDLTHHAPLTHDSAFELDESDIYHHTTSRSNSPEFCKPVLSSRLAKKSTSSCRRTDPGDRAGGKPSSLPVNVPDWSKILKDEYRRGSDVVDDGVGDDDDDVNGEDCLDGGLRVPLTSCWRGRWLGQGSRRSRFMKG
ncbi:unnamed protein product [Dovyalis caffra]|uniref:Uncharacterized protein n=1 Tax=Dovyalis caffra TaxID=77055 RepID=A0AAV1RDW2_9ROSI|nr:unnamed protein product [Dovyalis caffra]